MRAVQVLPVLLTALLLHASVPACSQTPSRMLPAEKQPVADLTSISAADRPRTICLYVQADDKSGAPVANLQPGDFTVLDNKQPQRIASVQTLGLSSVQGEAPAEVILAIDAINVNKETVIQEFDWLHQYLDKSGKQLALPTSLAFLQDVNVALQSQPTRDTAALAHYLEKNQPGFRALNRRSGGWGEIEREETSLNELNSIAAQVEKRPGRKLLIWIGRGWGEGPDPNERSVGKGQLGLFAGIVGESDKLRKARITLDMIDPTISGGRVFNFNYERFVKGVSEAKNAVFGNLMLPTLAAQSGGQVLYGSTNLPELIDRCVADAASYYVVTYDLPQASGMNDYHTVEVKVDRSDVVARTRTGYYSQP
jgi:VWFA-related protein